MFEYFQFYKGSEICNEILTMGRIKLPVQLERITKKQCAKKYFKADDVKEGERNTKKTAWTVLRSYQKTSHVDPCAKNK